VADHLSEEEQIEAFKRWWAENGLQLILALVLVVGGYFGWQSYQTQQRESAAQASEIYMGMIDIITSQPQGEPLNSERRVAVKSKADELKLDHSGSGYAQFAALLKAKLAVEIDDLDAAATELQWAMDNDPSPETERLVRLRLARVEASRGNVEAALTMVQGVDAADMQSAYEEAKGDFYMQLDNSDAAYSAYQAAIAANQSPDPMIGNILQLKLSQIQPAAVPVDEAEGDMAETAAEGDSQ
jgi:predicted negative regulator of RcsB-dependent stress response